MSPSLHHDSRTPDLRASTADRQEGTSAPVLPLYLAFVATGIGVALPGATLPLLLARWHLRDEGGGGLFFMAFIGSSLGALLLSGSLLRALALGSAAVASASLGLNFCTARTAPWCMLVFGFGLGLAMTAISLQIQEQATNKSRELVRLNLLWAIGACACPALALNSLRSADLRPLLYSLAAGFMLVALWAALQPGGRPSPHATESRFGPALLSARLRSFFRATPPALILLVMLTTGVEASAGGWLATYAKRGGDASLEVAAAPTCLWAGLLLSRLLWSFASQTLSQSRILAGSLALMAASSVTLILAPHGWIFFMAAACLGFGIGPAYPLLLARALTFQSSGIIFFLSGVCSAFLPWLTGFVSTQQASLRAGLFVPAVATLLMPALLFVSNRNRSNAAGRTEEKARCEFS